MEPVQNGESSRSPAQRSSSPRQLLDRNGDDTGPASTVVNGSSDNPSQRSPRAIVQSQLSLPAWDIPHPQPLHPSHDLITLLSLASLYNTYVRPYASGVVEEGANGVAGDEGEEEADGPTGQGKKRAMGVSGGQPRKLERGYIGLLDDCIDPVPNGTKAEPSLIPLIKDLTFQPTGPPPELWDGPIEIIPREKWDIAKLEVGSQSGYKGGEKDGVRKAEEKRRRKREERAKKLLAITIQADDTAGQASTPGTPLLPVLPPSKAGINGFSAQRQGSLSGVGTSRPPPINPATAGPGPRSGSGPPRTASFRPSSATVQPNTPGQSGGVKRAYEGQGAGMSKKAKIGGTRSASPMPGSNLARPGEGRAQQAQGKTQSRSGLGKGGRARTEGM